MNDSPSISEAPPVLETSRSTAQPLRYAHAFAFVAVWMALGWILRLDANSYLLLGVPLVALFQIFIRKKPIVTLWVRDAEHFKLKASGIIIGLCLSVLPAVQLFQAVDSTRWPRHIPEILWLVCCLLGAFCAAFSLSHFTKQTGQTLLFCLATAGVIGCAIMCAGFFVRVLMYKHTLAVSSAQLTAGIESFLLYFPVCFILEEVAFRGALDSHVHQSGDPFPWLSAAYVSALWGLWHLPTIPFTGILQLIVLVVALPCIHVAIGTFLSMAWRRSGNLAVTSTTHALIDAVRNALLT
jgi:membrane protease YdiL (CAAX protease family)